jgi:hypothetical protein
MNKFIFFIFLVLFSMVSNAYDKRKMLIKYAKVQKKVEKMVKKGWTFYAYEPDSSQIYLLNGKYRYTKVSFDEFYMPRLFQPYSKEYKPKQVGIDVIYFYKNGFNIILRKDGSFFKMKEGQITKFDPLEEDVFEIPTEKVENYIKSQCAYCSFKLSFNRVSVGDQTQFNGEVSWLPYYKLTDYTGLRFSLGMSPYTVENDNLDEVIDLGIKGQVLFRQYIWMVFFELGGGTLYFTDSARFSPMGTFGIGHTLVKPWWIFTDTLTFNNVFVHFSHINWDEQINEVKFGVGFAF